MQPTLRLQQITDECIAGEDPGPAMSVDALVEASTVLDATVPAQPGEQPDVEGLLLVASLHLIRSKALDNHPDQRHEQHAYMALYGLVHLLQPDAVPPQLRPTIAQAIEMLPPADLPTAILRAMEGHSAAVYAAWQRALQQPQFDVRLADVALRSRQRRLDVAGPAIAGYPARLLDLAALYWLQSDIPDRPTYLDQTIEVAEQALARDDVRADRALSRRAHLLLGPAFQRRAEQQHRPEDLAAAIASRQAAVDLTDPTDPILPARLERLAEAQQLRIAGDRAPTPRRFARWRPKRSAGS